MGNLNSEVKKKHPRARRMLTWVLVFDFCFLAALGWFYKHDRQWFLDQRFAFFSKIETGRNVFEDTPEELRGIGFFTDSPERRAAWKEYMLRELESLRKLPKDFDTQPTLEKAKILARTLSAGGGPALREDAVLIDKLRLLSTGAGFCSDHSECLLALCTAFGIEAREVSITHHTASGVYCPELKKWAWIDSEYLLTADDPQGRPLSGPELRDAIAMKKPFKLIYFGDPQKPLAAQNPYDYGFVNGPHAGSELIMSFGNNVFQVDEERQKLRWMPKGIRQLVYFAQGIMPTYRIYSDQYSLLPARLTSLRIQSLGLFALVMAINIGGVAAWYLERRRRRIAMVNETAPTCAPT